MTTNTEGLKPIYVRFAFGGFSAVSAHPDGSNDVALAEGFVKYVPEAAQASEAINVKYSFTINSIRNAALEVVRQAMDSVEVHPCDHDNDAVRAAGLSEPMAALYRALSTTPVEPVTSK